MDFISSTSKKINIWPFEHFFPPVFFPDQCWSGKNGGKSVQLVRGSFFRKYFLWNPYFSWLPSSSKYVKTNRKTLYLHTYSSYYTYYLEFSNIHAAQSQHFLIYYVKNQVLRIFFLKTSKRTVQSKNYV